MNEPETEKESSNEPGKIQSIFCSVCAGIGAIWIIISGIYGAFTGSFFKEGVFQGLATLLIGTPVMAVVIGALFYWLGRLLFGVVNSILNLE